MQKLILGLGAGALLSLSAALAQQPPLPYLPSLATRLEVRAAAEFTTGTIVPCPEYDVSKWWLVCVDITQSPWSHYEMTGWAMYGLDEWYPMERWTDTGELITRSFTHMDRREVLMVNITTSQVVFYVGAVP